MLTIKVPPMEEYWDSVKGEFVKGTDKEYTLKLEHSLYSISKWEEIHEKPFLGDGSEKYQHTPEEMLSYIKCMSVNNNVPDKVYDALTKENIEEVLHYIYSSRTATVINHLELDDGNPKKKEVITSELVYCWMTLLHIPPEYDRWFLNRLLKLIELCGIKNDPDPKKMSGKEYAAWRKAKNAERRAKSKARR